MNEHEIADVCWEVLGEDLKFSPTSVIPEGIRNFWTPRISQFAYKNASKLDSHDQVVSAFRSELELQKAELKAMREYWSSAMQRHHDYYVFLKRQEKLDRQDQPQYDLAMEREQQGLVKSLAEDAASPFG